MSGISKFPSYCLVICIALLLVEELGELTTFASNLPTFPYFLVGLALYCTSITFDNQTICITFTAKCGAEVFFNFRRIVFFCINALLLAEEFAKASSFGRIPCLQRVLPCLVLCVTLLLADKFGEMATFVKFVIFTACKGGPLVICIALLLADKFGEFAIFSRFVKFAIFATCNEDAFVLL